MPHTKIAAGLAGLALATMLAAGARAQDSEALASFEVMKPDVAVELAQAALAACRKGGYQVAVAVVDRFGQPQAIIRDRFAGPHTIPTAQGKAWTAVSFRGRTLALDQGIRSGELSEGLRTIPGALVVGGGVPVEAAGSVVGAIGVSGAPDPAIDEECALAGIAAIADKLEF